MKLHLSITFLLLATLTVGCKNMNAELEPWLATEDVELQNVATDDIRRHLDALKSEGKSFYGFVAVAGDYCTSSGPSSLSVAFNDESDIAPENTNDPFFRYCPEEWENELRDGFDATNKTLEASYNKFKSLHKRDANSFMIDRHETAFVARRDRAIINALKTLRGSGHFNDNTFLAIWFWGSQCPVTEESVQILNTPEIYKTFVSAFR